MPLMCGAAVFQRHVWCVSESHVASSTTCESETRPTDSHVLGHTENEPRQRSKGVEFDLTDSQIPVADVTLWLFLSFKGKNEAVCSQRSP